MPKRSKGRKAKGRAICLEEFERMLSVTQLVATDVGRRRRNDKLTEEEMQPTTAELLIAESWKHLLQGLWLSGLRLDESLHLYWDRNDCPVGQDCLEVHLDGRNSLLIIPAELEKGHADRLLPMVPEFVEFLEQTPLEARVGRVFRFYNPRLKKWNRIKSSHASTVLSRIGEQARVVVNKKTGKFASAHDLRRAFGLRWASRVMPQILMQLMRHTDIQTTLKYYVGSDAKVTANILWDAVENGKTDLGNILGNNPESRNGKPY